MRVGTSLPETETARCVDLDQDQDVHDAYAQQPRECAKLPATETSVCRRRSDRAVRLYARACVRVGYPCASNTGDKRDSVVLS